MSNKKDSLPFTEKRKQKKKIKMPTSFTIIFMVLVALMLISWILHYSGVTTTVENSSEPSQKVRIAAIGIVDLFVSIFEGFKDKISIIVFIFSIGAFIYVVMKSKSLDALTQTIAWKFKNKIIWAIPIIVTFLSFLGSTYGLAEEAIGFHMVIIPLMLAAGFDKFTAINTVLLGGGIGPMLATFDPFLIFAAVDASNGNGPEIVSQTDGLIFRLLAFVIVTAFTCSYIMIYANKVHKDPTKSYTFSTLEEDKIFYLSEQTEPVKLTKKRIWINIIFLLTFFIMISYLFAWDKILGYPKDTGPLKDFGNWINNNMPFLASFVPGLGVGDMEHVAAFFLISSLIISFLIWEDEETMVKDLLNGVKDMVGVAFIIGVAGAITVLLKKSYMSNLLSDGINLVGGNIKPFVFIIITFLLFLPISLAIPSTTAFATAIFPNWGKLASKVTTGTGVSMVSGSITAFAFANGFCNMISPASGIVVGAAQVGRMDYASLVKGNLKFYAILFILLFILLLIGTSFNYINETVFF